MPATAPDRAVADELCRFIDDSPSPYHAVETAAALLACVLQLLDPLGADDDASDRRPVQQPGKRDAGDRYALGLRDPVHRVQHRVAANGVDRREIEIGTAPVAGLSLIGVPGTAGFISKWYLILAALEQDQYWLAGAIVLSSMLAVAYVWRFVEVAYLSPPPAGSDGVKEAPLSLLLPAWLLIVATVWFGIDTSFSIGSATDAATQLLKAAP